MHDFKTITKKVLRSKFVDDFSARTSAILAVFVLGIYGAAFEVVNEVVPLQDVLQHTWQKGAPMSNFMIGVLVVMAVVIVALIAYVIALFNSLVQTNHNVDLAWANIEVLLKQRHDELPKLIDCVKRYMTHERGLLERLVSLRAQVGQGGVDAARLEAEGQISQTLGRLFAVAEGYPHLKADALFINLQSRISNLESDISYRREFYNDTVNINNVRLEQLPDKFLAGAAGLQPHALFAPTPAEMTDVNVGAALAPQ